MDRGVVIKYRPLRSLYSVTAKKVLLYWPSSKLELTFRGFRTAVDDDPVNNSTVSLEINSTVEDSFFGVKWNMTHLFGFVYQIEADGLSDEGLPTFAMIASITLSHTPTHSLTLSLSLSLSLLYSIFHLANCH